MSESQPPLPARPIRFVHRGREQQVSGLPPTTTVLQWLREQAHCTGTKEGCAEGDCGACTVMVGELNGQGQLVKRTVNSCIQLLPTLDGKVLYTVEDVAQGGQLHPCQQAMVDCHGSQCGFCTPGFVMSLWHVYQTHDQAPSRPELADALAGNLCRCTGYRPILDAGQQMFEAPRVEPDDTANLKALAHIQHHATQPLVYVGPSEAHGGHAQRFVAPTTLDELANWRLQWPQARLLAGSTDVGLWVTKQFKDLGDIIYIGQVQALRQIEHTATHLNIGAGASLEDAWSALTEAVPHLREIWLRFASPPIRHAGTLGGNVANGSPIGDGAPVLLALDATLVLRKGHHTRELPLSAFYVDYMKNALEAGEWLQSIRVPLPQADQGAAGRDLVRAYKISKRRDSDISAVCAGLFIRLQGDTIQAARLAWGGMAATAKRASQAEAAMIGQTWTEATLRQAQVALAQDFAPMTDLRASDRYRLKVAANLLERFWLETRPTAPLAPEQVQVWPATLSGEPT
ncbi:MAG: xanthine dehydrogenase small subunit [Burkholderiales bacterium]|nr:xanthine dehydrogenase small subunit [Burkholderiales bacterium]